MSTPLSELPIRLLTRGDLAPCADLAEDRGWAREDHKWRLLLTAGTGYGIDDPEGKGLAAACVVTSFGPDLAAVGMMLVAGRYARQGLGRRLMVHVLREAGDTPLALYATQYGRPLYQQLGFTDSGGAERIGGRFRIPGREPLPTTRPAAPGDLPVLARLDAEVLGVDRTPMIARLPAFADRLRVAEDGSTITGYAAAWPTPETDVIGPVVAPDVETAKALVCSLAMDSDRPVRMDVDVRHQELLDWLKENGLESAIRTTVMTYGIPELPGDWTRRFAPLSLATG
ncbi:GNAT family N-acetyltransferase [Streptomyces sp. AK02-01A]|uniref:GNAT family N-acetyltransferase n=1 Tax=Streptomyces sp. AK02-01A TaxID=3028648 RepID=UPI0029B89257|nr:GNAT family N-acetyltransferase [Streptomyces sp. AK02-01A]MDX3852966.1 GNAT family N-acetyltransferase [Streptomyces sp. AK02-01A]